MKMDYLMLLFACGHKRRSYCKYDKAKELLHTEWWIGKFFMCDVCKVERLLMKVS